MIMGEYIIAALVHKVAQSPENRKTKRKELTNQTQQAMVSFSRICSRNSFEDEGQSTFRSNSKQGKKTKRLTVFSSTQRKSWKAHQ